MAWVLGAIIAGGQSRRFGSDKAVALVNGRPMIDGVISALRPQVDRLVICGRKWADLPRLDDRPRCGLGPLAGLNAALHYGHAHGFGAVITVPIDVLPLPPDLLTRLAGDGPRVLWEQHLIGLWPVTLARALDAHLSAGHRSVRSWTDAAHATAIDVAPMCLRNINHVHDL